jgi:hypothetical protein
LQQGKIWELVSYVFLTFPGFNAAIGLVLFFMFGRQVESFFGQAAFIRLYVFLAVIPALVLLLVDAVVVHGFGASFMTRGSIDGNPRLVSESPFMPPMLMGSWALHTSVFVAFALLYPRAVFWFGLLAKWIATFLVAVHTLQLLFDRNWPMMIVLWSSLVLTYVLLRREGLTSRFPALESGLAKLLPSRDSRSKAVSRRRLKVLEAGEVEQVKPDPGVKALPKRRKAARRESPSEEKGIDELLDKISREGIQSLTNEERKRLERASSRLARRERSGS